MEDIVWRPFFPPLPTLFAAGLLAALALVRHARAAGSMPKRRLGLLLLRLGSIGGLTVVALGPSVVEPERERADGRPTLTLMVDTSRSMQTPDMGGRSRLAFVADRWLSRDVLSAFERWFDVEVVTFDTTARVSRVEPLRGEVAAVATGGGTNLAASVEQTLRRRTGGDGGALVLLSDGRDSAGVPLTLAAELARARALPVFAAVIGTDGLRRDVAVRAALGQPFLFAREPGTMWVTLSHVNASGSGSTLRVSLPGRDEPVAERPVRFTDEPTRRVGVPLVHDEPGVYAYEVAVDPLEGEAESGNNRQRVFVEVTDRRLKVLLLEGQPFWDTRFLAQSLRKDARIELTQWSRVSRLGRERITTRAEGDHAAPRSLGDLAGYDVVILGRSIERVLPASAWASLEAYVGAHGGRLVLARGRPYDPNTPEGRRLAGLLSPLEPLVWGEGEDAGRGARLELTAAGRAHPVFEGEGLGALEDAPPMSWAPTGARAKAGARVLVRAAGDPSAGDRPVVASMRYQGGRVLAVVGEGLWRWRLASRGDVAGETAYDRFWSGMVRYLALGSRYRPGRALGLRVSPRNARVGDVIHGELIARSPDPAARPVVTRIDPAGRSHRLEVEGDGAVRRFRFEPDQAGVYRIMGVVGRGRDAARVETRVSVVDLDLERLRASPDVAALRGLAEASGGRLLDPERPEALVDALERHAAASERVGGRPRYLWDRGWVVALLGSALGLEWIWRRMGGLA